MSEALVSNTHWLTAVHDITSGAPVSIKGYLQNTSAFLSSGAICFCERVENNGKQRQNFHTMCSPCKHNLKLEDSYELCVICLGAAHARSALEVMHYDKFMVRKLHSRLSLISREEGKAPAPCRSGPVAT